MDPLSLHNDRCFASHMGEWAIHADFMQNALAAIRAGLIPARAVAPDKITSSRVQPDQNGVAVLSLDGPLMKGFSKYGGTSTLWFRSALRNAAKDPAVSAVVVHVDSPGGTVAGTQDAAEEVRKANMVKPVYAHIDDLGASAAYWIASQARKVFSNPMAQVGSIGTYAVLYDTSGKAALDGVKVHVVSTGQLKGAGEPGTAVTPEMIAYVQERVNAMNEYFLDGIATGRGMKRAEVNKLADGRVWLAKEARANGLVDKVQSFDDTLAYVAGEVGRDKRIRAPRA